MPGEVPVPDLIEFLTRRVVPSVPDYAAFAIGGSNKRVPLLAPSPSGEERKGVLWASSRAET